MSKRSRRFDDHDFQPDFPPDFPPDFRSASRPVLQPDVDHHDDHDGDELVGRSTYVDAAKGPSPTPDWVITSADATDVDLGVFKTGKEADVSLVRRSHGDRSHLMAVKRYRSAEHRMFHRDAGYLEGRRERKSRERRAMATRTEFGRELIAGRWAAAEFAVLGHLWAIGAPVPYPVQLLGTELMMEFIGSPEGVAAPRLAAIRPDPPVARALFVQIRHALRQLADAGFAHGDLSPYNVLVEHSTDGGAGADARLVLIDVPQAVDLVGNPQGFTYLRRDCENICGWFQARGVETTAAELEADLLRSFGLDRQSSSAGDVGESGWRQ